MIEISDVTKVRPEMMTPRPLQQRIQWTGYAQRKPIGYLNRWAKRRHNRQKIKFIWLIWNLVANAMQQN